MKKEVDFNKKSDQELVALTLKDQNVFLYLMKKYEVKLLRYILRITSVSKEEAEDILQEVFIKVYKNLNGFDQNLKFSSWIYRITRNHVISTFRKNKNKKEISAINGDDEVEWLENFAGEINMEIDLDRALLRKNIYKILNKLDEKYREVLVLKYFEELEYQEISDILKKPMGTIATLLNRAKKKFIEQYIKQEKK